MKPRFRPAGLLLAVFLLQPVGIAAARLSPIDQYRALQILAWTLFGYTPLLLLATAAVSFSVSRRFAIAAGLLSIAILALAVDGFLIEPGWLEVSRVRMVSPKVQAPLRIALLSDLQTDAPGQYEAGVLAKVKAEHPDLILMTGDFLQTENRQEYDQAAKKLNTIFRQANLSAPLGIYSVPGNADRPGKWEAIFDGLPVRLIEPTTRLDLGPLVLTGLSLYDSFNTGVNIGPEEKFHVVMGHSPDYSLGWVDAELLLAGHTHGSQIRLPFFGPLFKLADIPRSWEAGATQIAPGKTLIVSRGIGVERRHAPRIRINCRPEIVIIEITPK